jgi:transposase
MRTGTTSSVADTLSPNWRITGSSQLTWGIYQRIVAAYRDPDRKTAKADLSQIIATISQGVPAALTELITLGRTLKRRADDVLAYFDRPGTSN